MRGAGYALLAVGVIVAIIGLLNKLTILHFGFSFMGHSNAYLIGGGAVLVVIGAILAFMADRAKA
jgi:hypothetical protein